jgi:tetratricopeptide (TPR) repeat protein
LFFDRPYETPVAALTTRDCGWVLAEAGFGLRAQGRFMEALGAFCAGVRLAEELQDWTDAAERASNLSQTELLSGEIAAALTTAEKSVALADRAGDAWTWSNRALFADALHAAGELKGSGDLFVDAERRQRERRSDEPLLYSLRGYRYCDLLLSQGRAAEACDRAAQTIEIARRHNWLLQIAFDMLTLGRANVSLALRSLDRCSADTGYADTSGAANLDKAVEGMRASGDNHHLPRGLLARAAFRRAVGDWDGAARDLDEAQEIAEPGPMRLYLCDCALERARLALARREAFAPLAGLVEPSPPPPYPPDTAGGAALREEARDQLDIARKLIAGCGYHRRDEELAELDAVVAGRRRFADLPPRVRGFK